MCLKIKGSVFEVENSFQIRPTILNFVKGLSHLISMFKRNNVWKKWNKKLYKNHQMMEFVQGSNWASYWIETPPTDVIW